MLLAMQMGNLAFTHLTNEVEVVVAYFRFKSGLERGFRFPFCFWEQDNMKTVKACVRYYNGGSLTGAPPAA
jgi:hypothetical protein